MTRGVLAILCFAASLASAAVTPLPGSTPQSAAVGTTYANPVRLRVTDELGFPVPGALVRWNFPPGSLGPIQIWNDSLCTRRLFDGIAVDCVVDTDFDGVAEISRLYAWYEGAHHVNFTAFDARGGASLGSARILLEAFRSTPALELQTSSKNFQSAVMGTLFPEPLIVRVLGRGGVPLAGARVRFDPVAPDGDTRGFRYPDATRPWVVTDEQGFATSPPIAAGWVPSINGIAHALVASVVDAESGETVQLKFRGDVTDAQGREEVAINSMWWAGPVESGWGLSVIRHFDRLFNVLFVYDDEGRPTWFAQPGGTWIEGVGATFAGFLYSPRSSPWFAYAASGLDVREPVAYMRLTLKGPEKARLDFRIDRSPGAATAKNIVRQDFTGDSPSPLQGVADMWWGGPTQNGWGVAIVEQFGNLFAVWFTYDSDGKPTWFVMPGGDWRDASTYAGTIYRTTSSPWVGSPYDSTKLRVGAVGPYVLRFETPDRATLDVNVDGVQRVLPLTRQPF